MTINLNPFAFSFKKNYPKKQISPYISIH